MTSIDGRTLRCARNSALTCRFKALRAIAPLAKRTLAEMPSRIRPSARKQYRASNVPEESFLSLSRILGKQDLPIESSIA